MLGINNMNKYASIYVESFNKTASAEDMKASPAEAAIVPGIMGAIPGAVIGGGIGALTGESEDPETGKKGTRLRNALIGAGIGAGTTGLATGGLAALAVRRYNQKIDAAEQWSKNNPPDYLQG
jgi:hypothetical protein